MSAGSRRQGREGSQLDLSGFDLRNAPPLAGTELAALKASDSIFYGLNLAGIGFAAAQLDRADLRSCNLRGADLRGVSLKGARLTNSDMRDCRLGPLVVNEGQRIVSRLDRAILRNVDLRGADLDAGRVARRRSLQCQSDGRRASTAPISRARSSPARSRRREDTDAQSDSRFMVVTMA